MGLAPICKPVLESALESCKKSKGLKLKSFRKRAVAAVVAYLEAKREKKKMITKLKHKSDKDEAMAAVTDMMGDEDNGEEHKAEETPEIADTFESTLQLVCDQY